MTELFVTVVVTSLSTLMLLAIPAGTIAVMGYPRVPSQWLVDHCGSCVLLANFGIAGALERPALFAPWAPSLAVALIPLSVAAMIRIVVASHRAKEPPEETDR